MRTLQVLVGLVLVVQMFLGCASIPAPGRTAITNVTLIDAASGQRENQTVIFDGNGILFAGASSSARSALPVAESIDGTGKFLIPGLWDMHVHLTYDPDFTELMPRSFLYYGITSVRDTGGLMSKMQPVVKAMRERGAVAPRVYYSGPLLDGEWVVYDGESRPEIGMANGTVEMARVNVAHLKEQGVDFIKIYELVAPDVYAALVAAARQFDLPIASHVPLSLLASEAGSQVDSMEHLRNIELDCARDAESLHQSREQIMSAYETGSGYALRSSLHKLQRLEAIAMHDEQRCLRVLARLRSTIQVPTTRLLTLSLERPDQRSDWKPAIDRMPASVQQRWLPKIAALRSRTRAPDTRFAVWAMEMISRLQTQGVPVGAGTDTPIGYAIPGYSLLNELDLLVRSGLSPLEALEAATIRPAEFLGLQDTMGSIEIGMKPDMVLLDANPLLDINHTRLIDRVISKGVVYDRSELR